MLKKIETVSHIWSVVCSMSAIDNESNNISLFNVLERATLSIPQAEFERIISEKAKGFLFPIPVEFISLFRKNEPEKGVAFDVRTSLLDPSGQRAQVMTERTIAIEKDKTNFRLRNRLSNLPINTEGSYCFIVEIKDVGSSDYLEVSRVPLEIFIKKI